jgi:hypothetical protein
LNDEGRQVLRKDKGSKVLNAEGRQPLSEKSWILSDQWRHGLSGEGRSILSDEGNQVLNEEGRQTLSKESWILSEQRRHDLSGEGRSILSDKGS